MAAASSRSWDPNPQGSWDAHAPATRAAAGATTNPANTSGPSHDPAEGTGAGTGPATNPVDGSLRASASHGVAPGAGTAGGARPSPTPITLVFGPGSKPSPKSAAGFRDPEIPPLRATPVPALDDSPVPLRALLSGNPAQGGGPPTPGVPVGGSWRKPLAGEEFSAGLCGGRAGALPDGQGASAGRTPERQAAAMDDAEAARQQRDAAGSCAGSEAEAGAAETAAGDRAGTGAALSGGSSAGQGLFTPLMLERLGAEPPAAGAAQQGVAEGQDRAAGGVTPAPCGHAAPAGLFTPLVAVALVEAHDAAPNQAGPKALHPMLMRGTSAGGVRRQAEQVRAPPAAAAGAPDQAPSPLSPDMDLLLAGLHTPAGAAGAGAALAAPTFTLYPDMGPRGRPQPPPATPEMQAIRALARPPPAWDALLPAPGEPVGVGGLAGEEGRAAGVKPAVGTWEVLEPDAGGLVGDRMHAAEAPAGGWEAPELAAEAPVWDHEHAAGAAGAPACGWSGRGTGPLCPVVEEEEPVLGRAAAPSPGAGPLRASMQARHGLHAHCVHCSASQCLPTTKEALASSFA